MVLRAPRPRARPGEQRAGWKTTRAPRIRLPEWWRSGRLLPRRCGVAQFEYSDGRNDRHLRGGGLRRGGGGPCEALRAGAETGGGGRGTRGEGRGRRGKVAGGRGVWL